MGNTHRRIMSTQTHIRISLHGRLKELKMDSVTSEELDTVNHLLARLDQLNEVGASLSRERNITSLLEKILLAAKAITHADGGTLYRMLEDGKTLRFEILRTDSLGIAMGGSAAESVDFPDLPLYAEDGAPNLGMVAAYAALKGQTVNIEDA